jgi:hypothetical protein
LLSIQHTTDKAWASFSFKTDSTTSLPTSLFSWRALQRDKLYIGKWDLKRYYGMISGVVKEDWKCR